MPSTTIASPPGGPEAARWLADDRWPDALALAEELLTDQPSDARALTLLAECCWRAGQLDRAAALYDRTLDLHPRNPRALAGQTWWALARGQTERGLEWSGVAIEAGPDRAVAWAARCAALGDAGRREEAVEALRATLDRLGTGGSATPEGTRIRHALEGVRTRIASPEVVTDARKGRLPLRIEDGLPLVSVQVGRSDGGLEEIPVLIDTGGSFAFGLDRSFESVLDAELGGRRVLRSGGRRHDDGRAATVATLHVGEWQLQSTPAVMFSIDENRPYRGILGPVLSLGRVLVFNFRKEAVAFLEATEEPFPKNLSDGETRTPFYVLGDGKALLPARLGSTPILALLDTGAATSRCSRRVRQENLWADLRLGDRRWSLPPPPASPLLDDEISPHLGVEVSLLLGMDFFRQFGIVTFDYAHRVVTWTPKSEVRRK